MLDIAWSLASEAKHPTSSYEPSKRLKATTTAVRQNKLRKRKCALSSTFLSAVQ
jgi:hypothetical protein